MAGHWKKACAPVWPRQVSLQGSPVSLSWERSLYFRVMVGGGSLRHTTACVCKNVESGASPPSVSLLSRADNVLWVQETRCSLLLSDGLAPQGPAQAQSCLCQSNYPASPLLLLQGLHQHSQTKSPSTHTSYHTHTPASVLLSSYHAHWGPVDPDVPTLTLPEQMSQAWPSGRGGDLDLVSQQAVCPGPQESTKIASGKRYLGYLCYLCTGCRLTLRV